jgi:hypothetical protein
LPIRLDVAAASPHRRGLPLNLPIEIWYGEEPAT